jgi:magnesium-transporting ATPase (P-type)
MAVQNEADPVDVEIGSKSVKFEYKPLLPPEEPYISLDAISQLHSDSHIDLMILEKSMGLTPEEATKRLNLYGRNALTPPPRMPEWQRFLLQFKILNFARNLLSFIVDCLHHQQGYN